MRSSSKMRSESCPKEYTSVRMLEARLSNHVAHAAYASPFGYVSSPSPRRLLSFQPAPGCASAWRIAEAFATGTGQVVTLIWSRMGFIVHPHDRAV